MKLITDEQAYNLWLEGYDEIIPFKSDDRLDFIYFLSLKGLKVIEDESEFDRE